MNKGDIKRSTSLIDKGPITAFVDEIFDLYVTEVSREKRKAVELEFTIGMHVRKRSGYDWPGTVCGYGFTSIGTVLVNVENRLSPGTVHIYPPRALMPEDRSNSEILFQGEAAMTRIPKPNVTLGEY